jgi:hypothetical protein
MNCLVNNPDGVINFLISASRVVDPYYFFRIRIRIQSLRLETNTDPDPDPIRIQGFNDQKLIKNYSWKFLIIFFISENAIYLSLGLHKVCPSYRRSLQLSKEAIQHFKTWTLTNFFLLLWVIFALLDPDPDPDSEYGTGSGSTDPIEYGSKPDPDPDPQPCACRYVLVVEGAQRMRCAVGLCFYLSS